MKPNYPLNSKKKNSKQFEQSVGIRWEKKLEKNERNREKKSEGGKKAEVTWIRTSTSFALYRRGKAVLGALYFTCTYKNNEYSCASKLKVKRPFFLLFR